MGRKRKPITVKASYVTVMETGEVFQLERQNPDDPQKTDWVYPLSKEEFWTPLIQKAYAKMPLAHALPSCEFKVSGDVLTYRPTQESFTRFLRAGIENESKGMTVEDWFKANHLEDFLCDDESTQEQWGEEDDAQTTDDVKTMADSQEVG